MSYCLWMSVARYGSRDEYVGTRGHKVKCFKKRRVAEKALMTARRADDNEDVSLYLCKGSAPCRGYGKKAVEKRIRRHNRKKPSTSKSRRASRRGIPF